jgi:hypothetical protein
VPLPPGHKPPLTGAQLMLAVKRGAANGCNNSLKVFRRLSKPQVPKESGRLDESYAEERATVERTAATGSYNTAYAAAQHERTDWKHPVGKAKFASDPVKTMAGLGIHQAAVADGVHDALERRLPRRAPGR